MLQYWYLAPIAKSKGWERAAEMRTESGWTLSPSNACDSRWIPEVWLRSRRRVTPFHAVAVSGRYFPTSSSRETFPSCTSSITSLEMNCLLTEAIPNAVVTVAGVCGERTEYPHALSATGRPARSTATATPGMFRSAICARTRESSRASCWAKSGGAAARRRANERRRRIDGLRRDGEERECRTLPGRRQGAPGPANARLRNAHFIPPSPPFPRPRPRGRPGEPQSRPRRPEPLAPALDGASAPRERDPWSIRDRAGAERRDRAHGWQVARQVARHRLRDGTGAVDDRQRLCRGGTRDGGDRHPGLVRGRPAAHRVEVAGPR